MALDPASTYRFGTFVVHPQSRTVTYNGQPVTLTARTFDLLLYMVRNPGRVLSKDELLRAVWGETVVEEGNLTQSIFLIRKALGKPGEPALIVTLPGRGYQFTGQLEADCEEIKSSAASAPAKIRWTKLGTVAVSGALILLVSSGFAAWYYFRSVPGDHHEVLLADFENSTGEAGFESVLKSALAIDLRQSPYLSIASEARMRQTLRLMERRPDERLTGPLVREVCQRMNDQAVLGGAIARFGEKYLVTLTAWDCVSGQELVQSKAVAEQRDNLVQAVDAVAAEMRRRLGEPLRSLSRFNKPLLAKETGSFEALRAYSQAHELAAAGKFQEAMPLYQRAVELDPKFAAAHADKGVLHSNLGESGKAKEELRKAYELRDFASQSDQLHIISQYHLIVTGDLHESVRNYEAWTELYPQADTPWINLGNALTQLGQYDRAMEAAKHGLERAPGSATPYIVLARAQLYGGRVEEAFATCSLAIAKHLDGADIHGVLMRIGAFKHKREMIREQISWAKGTTNEPYITLQHALLLVAEGKSKAAMEFIQQLVDGYRKEGMKERAERMRGGAPRLLAELGLTEQARRILAELPAISGSTDIPVALAETGQPDRAEALLQEALHEAPEDTLWTYFRGPEIRAVVALARHKPEVAIDVLKPAIPYEFRNLEVPYLRGLAYLDARQPALAQAEFQKVLDHPTIEVFSHDVALSHVGLARALAMQGKTAASIAVYENFLEFWKDAEADVPVLSAAKAEYARLVKGGV